MFFSKGLQRKQFRLIPGRDLDEEFEDDTNRQADSWRYFLSYSRAGTLLPWILTLVFGISSTFQYLTPKCGTGSFEKGWLTDFGPVRPFISIEKVRYTGGPEFGPDGSFFVPNPDPVEYKGSGHEVDLAWEQLTWGRYFVISKEDAERTFGNGYTDLYNEEVDGYEVGLDMFHTLHCLNNLRKLLHPNDYPPVQNHHAKIHDEHCIEQLRQQVMCAGDVTPIPVKYVASINKSYVYSDVVHTCRNFDMIQSWMLETFNAQPERMKQILINQ